MKRAHWILFILTLAFYGFSFLAPHKLVLFLFCGMYFFVLWRFAKNFKHAFIFLYFTLMPIIVGKLIPIELIPAQLLNIPGRPFGISSDVIITISDMVIVAMAIVLAREAVLRTLVYERHYLLEFLLFLYPVTSVVATLLGSVRPEISILHSMYTIRPLILYYFIVSSTAIPVPSVFSVMSAGLLFEFFLVVAQTLHRGPLGLIIEPIANYVAIDLSRDAVNLARYGGTYMHANALANALLIPLFLLLPSLFEKEQKAWKFVVISFFAGAATLALSLSRSAWFGVAVGGGIFFYVAIRMWKNRAYALDHLTKLQQGLVTLLIIVLSYVMIPRVLSTFFSGGQYGSLETRLLLLREYSQTITTQPYFGVGLEMDVYVQYLRSKVWGNWNVTSPNRSVILYFPEPVHNGLLRLLVEVGLVGTLPFVGIFSLILFMIWKRLATIHERQNRLFLFSLFALCIGVFVNSCMQPILPDLPLLVSLTMIYLRNLS